MNIDMRGSPDRAGHDSCHPYEGKRALRQSGIEDKVHQRGEQVAGKAAREERRGKFTRHASAVVGGCHGHPFYQKYGCEYPDSPTFLSHLRIERTIEEQSVVDIIDHLLHDGVTLAKQRGEKEYHDRQSQSGNYAFYPDVAYFIHLLAMKLREWL